jgi:hypothetical protein
MLGILCFFFMSLMRASLKRWPSNALQTNALQVFAILGVLAVTPLITRLFVGVSAVIAAKEGTTNALAMQLQAPAALIISLIRRFVGMVSAAAVIQPTMTEVSSVVKMEPSQTCPQHAVYKVGRIVMAIAVTRPGALIYWPLRPVNLTRPAQTTPPYAVP